MFSAIKAFFGSLLSLTRRHYVLMPVFLILFVVLAGGVVRTVYYAIKARVPGGARLPDAS